MREYTRRPYQFTRLHSPAANQGAGKPEDPKHKSPLRKSPLLIVSLIFLVVAATAGLFLMLRTESGHTGLPAEITSKIVDFKPYYFQNDTPPAKFTLKESSASFSGGIFTLSLTNDQGYTVGIAEQKIPPEFANSILQGNESFETAFGKATLSTVSGGRTTGSLASSDGTLILLNTADPVELSVIKDMLRSLAPLR